MTTAPPRSPDDDTLTVLIDGQPRRYANDKAGKRQVILDGLGALETVSVGQDIYLPSSEALQVVAAVLYPRGIQTEKAYQTVVEVTEKACAHLGYGEEQELGPPHVSFAARGRYRRRMPPVDLGLALEALELAGASSYEPRREVVRRTVWNKVAWELYERPLNRLTDAQAAHIEQQVDVIAAEVGWSLAEADRYTRPLPVDATAAREQLGHYLRDLEGRPVPVRSAVIEAQRGAYGRAFYQDEPTAELAAVIAEILTEHGYQTEPAGGDYRPIPARLPDDASEVLAGALAACQTVDTVYGRGVLLAELLTAVRPFLSVETLSDWQTEQLLQTGPLNHALRKQGFQTTATACLPYQFRPPLDASGEESRRSRQVLLKEVRVRNDPDQKLSLADGLAVYTPALAIDDEDETLVYLEMIGPKQSVRANWAALVGGGKVHWLGRKRLRLEGMRDHLRLQTALPCGWTDTVLLHKQASLKAMSPERPFYLLDDGAQPIPPLFYAMLNKALALPLLGRWSEYLWQNGRECELITLLDGGEGQGYAAWRVLPAPEAWQEIVQGGLAAEEILF